MTDALDKLASQADHLDNEAPAPDGAGAASGPAAPPDPTQSPNYMAIGFILAGFRELASAMLKVQSLKRTLDDTNVGECARVLAPVADKYGIDLGSYLSGPEGAALMVAGPILWTAWRELDAELRARRAKPITDADAAPTSTTGTGGDGGQP